jgi:hypothetical protein
MEPVMKPRGSLFIVLLVVLVAAGPSYTEAGDGSSSCLVQPWDTVDNGMGAEPGVVREFASGLTMPSECLNNGQVFIPFVEVTLTRLSGGSSSLDLEIFIRAADPVTGEPTGITTPPHSVTADGIPVFPASATYEFPLLPAGTPLTEGAAYKNTLWGDYQYVGTSFSGDNNLVFIIADESGPAGETPCRTGINGAVPVDDCLNGNPILNSAGHSYQGPTFYGRYNSGAFVSGDNREPLGTTWGARYFDPGKNEFGPATNLRIRDGLGGPIVCEYFNIPVDFEFDCVMTPGQAARHDSGDLFAELEVGGNTKVTRIYPAGALIFVDFFESGDTGVWSSTTP